MFPVLLAEEDCSIKRGQPSITRDLPKSSSFLAEVFLTIYHYCYGVVGNVDQPCFRSKNIPSNRWYVAPDSKYGKRQLVMKNQSGDWSQSEKAKCFE